MKRQNIPYRPALEAGLRQEAAAIKGGKGFLCQWGRMIARIGMATTGKGVQLKVIFFRFLFADDQKPLITPIGRDGKSRKKC